MKDSKVKKEKWWIAEHHEEKAHHFLEALSPISGLLGPAYLPGGWLYRGVGNDGYHLLPSAFRRGSVLLNKALLYDAPLPTLGYQIKAELGTLTAFIEAADCQGHTIPEDSQSLRRYLAGLDHLIILPAIDDRRIPVWPDLTVLSALGLAQHYRVPTRMLDWTLNPYIAAYFAASSAVSQIRVGNRLCIWALLEDIVEFEELFSDGGIQNNRLPLKLVTAPGAGNSNLKAQRGVFLVYQQFDIDPSAEFVPQPYDELLVENLKFLAHQEVVW